MNKEPLRGPEGFEGNPSAQGFPSNSPPLPPHSRGSPTAVTQVVRPRENEAETTKVKFAVFCRLTDGTHRKDPLMKDALDMALKKLRLSGLLQTLEVRLQEASGNHLTHMEFLELILQDELTVRQDRMIQRRVKAAGFREMRTLEDFDWQFNPSIKRKQVFDLATCRFIKECRDVLLLGPPGGVT